MHCVFRCAAHWHRRVVHQEGEIAGEINSFKLGATEAVDQRVQETVHVGEDHEAIKGHRRFILAGFTRFLHPGNQQDHPGYGAGQEADGEHHHNGGHQEDGPPQLRLVPDRLLPEPVDDACRAVDHDDEGNDDLGEEDHLSQTVHHVLLIREKQPF